MKWYCIVLKKYLDFNGRACLKEFWMFTLIDEIIFNILVLIVPNILAVIMPNTVDPGAGTVKAGLMLAFPYRLAVFLPKLAVTVRRIHDSDESVWWVLFSFYWMYLLCIRGTQGENRFGPDPLQGE